MLFFGVLLSLLECELVDLLSERAALRQAGLPAGRLAQHHRAAAAKYHCLRMGENCRNRKAPRALHVHKVRVGPLYQPLELVLALLRGGVGVKEVHRHSCEVFSWREV